MGQINLVYSRNRVTDVEKNSHIAKGREEGGKDLGDWDWHAHTAMYKIGN